MRKASVYTDRCSVWTACIKSGFVPGSHSNGGGWRTETLKSNQTDPGPLHPMVLSQGVDLALGC